MPFEHPLSFRPPNRSDVHHRLVRARAFMDECYDQPLDLDRISNEAFFSPYHFLRLFRKTFHQTPHQYLTRRRIEQAKYLLKHSERSVTEVCFDVGFESLGSFSSLFRRCVGTAPTAYRSRIFEIVRYPVIERVVPACFITVFGQWTVSRHAFEEERRRLLLTS